MKEKMNLADGPNDSNSDDEGVVHRKDSKLSTQVHGMQGSGSVSSLHSAAKMIPALPEDREIISEIEEEEEEEE